MRRITVKALIVFLLIGVIPALCLGQNVGKVAGRVTDADTGEPLQFTNIVIVGTPMGGMSLADGLYAILNVAPGTYDVQATYMGYKPVRVEGVVVNPGLTQMVDFQLEKTVAAELEPIIVQAERPIVQVDVTSTRHIMSTEDVQSLPVDNPANIVNFISGTAVDARGSHIRGGREDEVGYYVDNSPIQDPIDNNSMLFISTQAVNEMVVFTGGFNAEYGNASSGIVNIITNEGSDKFKGYLEYRSYIPLHMFWNTSDTGDWLDTGERRGRAFLSGPIYQKGTNDFKYVVGLERSDWDDYELRVEALDRPASQKLYDLVLTFRHARSKLKAVFNYEDSYNVGSYDSYRLYERLRVPWTWRRADTENFRVALTGSHMINDRSFVEGSVSYVDNTYERAMPGRKWEPSLSYQDNQDKYDWDLDIRRDEDNFIISGDNPYYDYQEKSVLAFRAAYTLQKGRNEVKTGLDLNFYDVKNHDIFASTANFYIYEYDVNPWAGAFYAQDKLEFEGLIMNLGLRVDWFDPNTTTFRDFNHPYWLEAPKDIWHGPDQDNAPIEYEYTDEDSVTWGGLKDATTKWKLSPRLGVSHPITESSYLHFLYGHFFQMPSFNYLFANHTFHTRGRWLSAGNADLESEKTVAYEIGVNHMISSSAAVDLTFFYKDITDMTEMETVGPTVESNPQARENFVFYENSGYANVRGFEINLKRPWAGNWRYHAAYTFMVGKGFSSDVNEGYLRRFDDEEFPTQQFYLDWDRRHTFLFTGGYSKPKNWSTDVSIRYATGAPYTHPLQLGKKPSRNFARFPAISSVDWEIHKWFSWLDVEWDIFLRMTNVFNQQNLINWDDTDQDLRNWLVQNPGDYLGPFGDYTIYGPARNAVAGVRVNF
jgi:hypothetical protein